MVLSLYTYLFEKEGDYYLYNSQNGLLISVAKSIYESLYDGNIETIEKGVLEFLAEKRIIVEQKHLYDYYYYSKLSFLSAIGNNDSLHLLIAPTTGCNFACPYCYEGKKTNKRMTPEVVENLIAFINGYKDTKELAITWYGGEPLIAFNIVKEIVHRIKNECPIKLSSQSIVTNGYLLNVQVIDFMKNNHFNNIQVTFDGTEPNHNKTRFLKVNHRDTYQRIWKNLDNLIRLMPKDFKIALRININKENELDFATMLRTIKEKYSQKNVMVYPGFIRESNKNNTMCYNTIFGKSRIDFYKKLSALGITVDYFPKEVQKGCMSCHNNQLIIGPEGEIYKCWNDFNNPKKIVGFIKDKRMSNPSLINRYAYEATIYNQPECKECKVFPICTGGCSWLRYQNMYQGKNFDVCTYLKDKSILEECLFAKEKRTPFKVKAYLNV